MPALTLSEFSEQITELMPIIAREFVKNHVGELHKIKITAPQSVVLDLVERQGEVKMSDLARSLEVTTAAMTGIVDRLVRDGYAERLNDPLDRRIIRIKLKSKGSKVLKTLNEHRKKVTMKIFGMVSQEERENYLKTLMHIKEYLK